MKVSNCCGAKDRQMNVHGVEYSDLELCPSCKEPCEFIEQPKPKFMTAQEARQISNSSLYIPTSEHIEIVGTRAKAGYDYSWGALTNEQVLELFDLGYKVEYSDHVKQYKISW